MGIDVEDAEAGEALRVGAERAERDRVVAAQDDRRLARGEEPGHGLLDQVVEPPADVR